MCLSPATFLRDPTLSLFSLGIKEVPGGPTRNQLVAIAKALGARVQDESQKDHFDEEVTHVITSPNVKTIKAKQMIF